MSTSRSTRARCTPSSARTARANRPSSRRSAACIGPMPASFFWTAKEVFLRSPADAINHGIVVIHQELSLAPHLSVAENIFLGHFPRTRLGFVDRRSMYGETSRLLRRLHIDIDPRTLAVDLSVAQQQMVEIAKAISFDAKVLILDEPTAVLDESMVVTLFDLIAKLKAEGTGDRLHIASPRGDFPDRGHGDRVARWKTDRRQRGGGYRPELARVEDDRPRFSRIFRRRPQARRARAGSEKPYRRQASSRTSPSPPTRARSSGWPDLSVRAAPRSSRRSAASRARPRERSASSGAGSP